MKGGLEGSGKWTPGGFARPSLPSRAPGAHGDRDCQFYPGGSPDVPGRWEDEIAIGDLFASNARKKGGSTWESFGDS